MTDENQNDTHAVPPAQNPPRVPPQPTRTYSQPRTEAPASGGGYEGKHLVGAAAIAIAFMAAIWAITSISGPGPFGKASVIGPGGDTRVETKAPPAALDRASPTGYKIVACRDDGQCFCDRSYGPSVTNFKRFVTGTNGHREAECWPNPRR